jgi:hypothetical protein
MEINPSIVVGATLNEIQKKSDHVKMVFENKKIGRVFTMSFDGFLLETAGSALDQRVGDVKISRVLGFRTMSQVRAQGKDPSDYQQLLIQMEGSRDDYKLELLGAFKNYKIMPKAISTTGSRSKGGTKRKTVRS